MKLKWTIVFTLAFLACIFVIVRKTKEVKRLQSQVRELGDERRSLLMDRYQAAWTVPDERQMQELRTVYADIVTAYTNEDLLAIRTSISRLPRVDRLLHWQVAEGLKSSFVGVLNASFLRIRELRDFGTVEAFDRYATVSLEAARFYGESEIRRKYYDFPIAVEYLTLKVLQRYIKKFQDEGREDLAKAAERYRTFWIARIDSLDGLTRQCAWHEKEYNTIFIRAIRPERALTDEQGLLQARQTARGLINSGYRPRWLDVDFPLPTDENANAKVHDNR